MRIHVLYNYYLLLLCRFCTFTYSINTIQCVTVVTLFEKQNLELVQNFPQFSFSVYFQGIF